MVTQDLFTVLSPLLLNSELLGFSSNANSLLRPSETILHHGDLFISQNSHWLCLIISIFFIWLWSLTMCIFSYLLLSVWNAGLAAILACPLIISWVLLLGFPIQDCRKIWVTTHSKITFQIRGGGRWEESVRCLVLEGFQKVLLHWPSSWPLPCHYSHSSHRVHIFPSPKALRSSLQK